MSFDYEECRKQLVKLVQLAGREVSLHKGHNAHLQDKDGACPAERLVTIGDVAATALIRDHLDALYPDIPVFDEESVDSGAVATPVFLPERFFLVDPLDGTAEFDECKPYWSVQIALIERGRSVATAIAMPGVFAVYSASIEREGVVYEWSSGNTVMRESDHKLKRDAYISYNERWSDAGTINRLSADFQDTVRAQGMGVHVVGMEELDRALTTLRLGHQLQAPLVSRLNTVALWSQRGSLWDVMAWQLPLEKLGGRLCTHDGQDIIIDSPWAHYDDKPFRVPPIVMLPPTLKNHWTPIRS